MGFITKLLGFFSKKAFLWVVGLLIIAGIVMFVRQHTAVPLVGKGGGGSMGKDAVIHFLRTESESLPQDGGSIRIYFYEEDFDQDGTPDLAISSPKRLKNSEENWYLYRAGTDNQLSFLGKIYFDPDLVSIRRNPEEGGDVHSRFLGDDSCRRLSYQITSSSIEKIGDEKFALNALNAQEKEDAMYEIIGHESIRNTGELSFRDIFLTRKIYVRSSGELESRPTVTDLGAYSGQAELTSVNLELTPGDTTLILTNPDRGDPTGLKGVYLSNSNETVDVRIPIDHVNHGYRLVPQRPPKN